uniref:type II toxin-antitoxin system HigB family toxin n=1 Tax=Salmonella enterica TaxID=28901 RepID=UPI003299E1C6
ALTELLNVLEKKKFTQPEEMKRYIPSQDNFKYRDKCWVIDVSCNRLRIISYIDFMLHNIFVKNKV